jgi:hypothetical protein
VNNIMLFITATIMGGMGGLIGSVAGGGLGNTGVFVGGLLGGVLIAPVTAIIAQRRGWIVPGSTKRVTLGTALGFLAAATIAVNTLSSLVGPVLSTLLVGFGALLGARSGSA